MAFKSLRSSTIIILIVLLFGILSPPGTVQALGTSASPPELPTLGTFVNRVKNGQADEVRGVYVPKLFAFPVLQQPAGDHGFVSPGKDSVTQFRLASRFGSTGLLAHNYLAGQEFFSLEKGTVLYLVYGDGRLLTFMVTDILHYQALEPASTASPFVRLQDDALLTASELFAEVYNRDGIVVLQTCLSREGNLSWGRLFVIAEPYSPAP